jgi:hypothetical protein
MVSFVVLMVNLPNLCLSVLPWLPALMDSSNVGIRHVQRLKTLRLTRAPSSNPTYFALMSCHCDALMDLAVATLPIVLHRASVHVIPLSSVQVEHVNRVKNFVSSLLDVTNFKLFAQMELVSMGNVKLP